MPIQQFKTAVENQLDTRETVFDFGQQRHHAVFLTLPRRPFFGRDQVAVHGVEKKRPIALLPERRKMLAQQKLAPTVTGQIHDQTVPGVIGADYPRLIDFWHIDRIARHFAH